MPDGSSSDAPVIRPGPSDLAKSRGLNECGSDFCSGSAPPDFPCACRDGFACLVMSIVSAAATTTGAELRFPLRNSLSRAFRWPQKKSLQPRLTLTLRQTAITRSSQPEETDMTPTRRTFNALLAASALAPRI